MKNIIHRKVVAGVFFYFLMAAAFAFPGARADAATLYGQITSSWTKAGSYSYQLKQNGTLVFKNGDGKEEAIAKGVSSARYYGSQVAYAGKKATGKKTKQSTAFCGIYNCASGKMVRIKSLNGAPEKKGSSSLLPLGKINGFYGNTVTFYCGSGTYCLASVNMNTGIVRCLTTGKTHAGGAKSGAVQNGKYLVYIHRHTDQSIDTLEVFNMSSGRIRVITKKGYAVLVKNNKLYYAEVLREKEHFNKGGALKYDIPEQTVRIYCASMAGTSRKLLGSFKTQGDYLRNYLDEEGDLAELAIIPDVTGVYVFMRNSSYLGEYYSMKYSNGKLTKSTGSVFMEKGKLAGLVSEGVTWAWQ